MGIPSVRICMFNESEKGEELRFNLDPIDKKRARSECIRNLISKGVEWFYNSKVRAFEPENKES
jgi:hypothetical protein